VTGRGRASFPAFVVGCAAGAAAPAAGLGGPVRVAPYATFGTDELAGSVIDAFDGRSAVLLGSHGTLTIGESLAQAYWRSVLLEWLATLYYRATQLGEPRLLPGEEIERVAEKLRAMRR